MFRSHQTRQPLIHLSVRVLRVDQVSAVLLFPTQSSGFETSIVARIHSKNPSPILSKLHGIVGAGSASGKDRIATTSHRCRHRSQRHTDGGTRETDAPRRRAEPTAIAEAAADGRHRESRRERDGGGRGCTGYRDGESEQCQEGEVPAESSLDVGRWSSVVRPCRTGAWWASHTHG